MLRVALNAMFLDPGVSSGTETYVRGLVPELGQRAHVTLFTTRRGARALAGEGWGVDIVALAADEGQRLNRLAAELVSVPRRARRGGADVLHSLANTGPIRARVPHVMTIHDVNWLHEPTLPKSTTLALKLIVGPAARNAAAVTCVSHAAADEVRAALRVERVTVIPNGAGRPATAAPRKPAFDVPDRFVLCVGVLRRHKNQGLLIDALEHLPADVGVVLVGAHEDYAATLRERAGPRVVIPGYVPDAELEWLWRHAACAAFPTRAEGFGLPVVEAIERGVPVAASDLPVLREVAGDAPEFFSPDDPAGAAAAIMRAIERPPHPATTPWTWAQAAERAIALYERCVAARGR